MSFNYDQYAVIEIDISAKVKQTIRVVNPELTAEDIVNGLNEGLYMATIDHDGVNCVGMPIVDQNEKTVAMIGSQIADYLDVHHVAFSVDPLESELNDAFLPEDENEE